MEWRIWRIYDNIISNYNWKIKRSENCFSLKKKASKSPPHTLTPIFFSLNPVTFLLNSNDPSLKVRQRNLEMLSRRRKLQPIRRAHQLKYEWHLLCLSPNGGQALVLVWHCQFISCHYCCLCSSVKLRLQMSAHLLWRLLSAEFQKDTCWS